jgi:hypothetical protein
MRGPLLNEGHAVYAVAYDGNGVTVLTGETRSKVAPGWRDECLDEAYAILLPQAQKPGFAKGFAFAQPQADLHDVAN